LGRGAERGLAAAGRLGGFRQRERDALADRRPRGERRRDIVPDRLHRLGPGLAGAHAAQDAEAQVFGILDGGPVADFERRGGAAAAVLLVEVEAGLRIAGGYGWGRSCLDLNVFDEVE
jgi:hypothetical protein